jgi:hypothetical protein
MSTTTHGIKPGIATPEVDPKRLASLKARAALAGHTLSQVNSGFVLSRWTHSKHCSDLATVEEMLKQMGAMQ